jgi:hypothetical protein
MADTEPLEFWIRINPSGCVTGSVRESFVGRLTEDAHKEFTPRVADRRREAAEGWRHELIGRSDWTRRAEPCIRGRCGHDQPKKPAARHD